MAQATNLTLKNAASANVLYGPRVIRTGDIAIYRDDSAGLTEATRGSASLGIKETALLRRVEGKVAYPELVDGVVQTSIADFRLKVVKSMTEGAKAELLARIRALIDDAIVTAATDKGETPW